MSFSPCNSSGVLFVELQYFEASTHRAQAHSLGAAAATCTRTWWTLRWCRQPRDCSHSLQDCRMAVESSTARLTLVGIFTRKDTSIHVGAAFTSAVARDSSRASCCLPPCTTLTNGLTVEEYGGSAGVVEDARCSLVHHPIDFMTGLTTCTPP